MKPPRAPNDPLTPSQRQAVAARGNVLVMAGAGTGKTRTLVARCLDCLDRERVSLDALLIVTFTEVAAAELRQRLRRAMEERAAAESNNHPSSTHHFWNNQLVLFDIAHIGTLHSFCLRLVREHFHELGLDPQLAILDEGEARQLADETLDEQFQAHYAGDDEFSLAVQNLIQVHGGGRDEKIRALILRLHHYSQTRPDAAGWLAEQITNFSATEPVEWKRWLLAAIEDWRNEWLPVFDNLESGNEKAAELKGILSRLKKDSTREFAAEVLDQVISADGNWPAKRKTALRKPLQGVFDEAAFLAALAPVKNGDDPLVEDWSWVRGQMKTLLQIAQQFTENFARRKRDDGVLDFHDLEQFALKLLWNFSAGKPTAVAGTWRKKLCFVFVDEYQDINAAQDKIIAALSRDGAEANRFLVGDVKQSIYRFRLADPKIFRDYAKNWRGDSGKTIPLATNFRSCESLLNFVNSVFRQILREEIGGVAYDANAELKFGLSEKSSIAGDKSPRVELLVRLKNGRNDIHEAEEGELANLDDPECEARLVAQRLQEFVAAKHEIFDEKKNVFRAVEWRDTVILLRSPRGRSEIFAKEFARAGIPLDVARGGFYESAEILDLLSLLELLDNPLQDLPCIAVLRSPLVGLSLDELAEIRLAAKDKHFWTALVRSQEPANRSQNESATKISKFLERFARWRMLAKQASLSECLEAVLAETLYADWLRAQPRGAQRAANIASLLNLAQSFDQFQQRGLYRFLKFIEAQQTAEAEPEAAAAAAENAVRLMSIHQSKGLEFPVVVLPDLSKKFNEQDLHGEIIFDEEFGLCPKVKPPSSGRRYPSLPHWLAQRRQRRELRGEELRLFYVALTRARDRLILTASLTAKKWETLWSQREPVTPQRIADAGCFADWLGLWFSVQSPKSKTPEATNGELRDLCWRLVADAELAAGVTLENETRKVAIELPALDEKSKDRLQKMLAWSYPFAAATKRKAKSSVTDLRRVADELDDEAEPVFKRAEFPGQTRKGEMGKRKLSAADSGTAHHKFLQHFALEKTGALAAEVERLARQNYLSAEECAVLDLEALAAFWSSELGGQIRANAGSVRRELPFTARFSPAELDKITGVTTAAGLHNEFVVVQGVADLVVLLPAEIWLVDFKTDDVRQNELAAKIKTYAPQLKLYAQALERIFLRPVTICQLHFLALRHSERIV